MRLLFDQNISFRVVKQLKPSFPETIGVREAGLYNADDFQIWEFASTNGYTVVTFDKDLPDIGAVRGFPPKIIWLRTGNVDNQALVNLFLARADDFHQFINSADSGTLLVYLDHKNENE